MRRTVYTLPWWVAVFVAPFWIIGLMFRLFWGLIVFSFLATAWLTERVVMGVDLLVRARPKRGVLG